ncbi:uncharacterized protein BO80DRAFT_208644 [Aspergillus ibericus CBS 121593]|uniref:Uncharacterized protein n=1 Tax=Aspergillus ibericus CBS 121593 TaxID=1448316 RepID=A0A395HA45_9EURO|nr:hypothetical protein BO80DRAFT_208644 [Aspergillus ibericus CBS 121593]RAL04787.1 hypothetical protein BO80DRAFT_208644 [Aspergillus ibericus CBS 121593]
MSAFVVVAGAASLGIKIQISYEDFSVSSSRCVGCLCRFVVWWMVGIVGILESCIRYAGMTGRCNCLSWYQADG